MTALKSARTLAASLGVLAIGALAATPAMAFDDVDWDWTKDVKEYVDIDVDIDIDLEATGLVEIEKLQIFLGNVYASSTVHDIENIQYDRDEYFDSRFYDDGVVIPAAFHGLEFLPCLCRGNNCDIDAHPFDATIELPSVVSSATAVGNNQSITSDVPVFLHDGQFVANTWFNWGGDPWVELSAAMPSSVQNPGGGWDNDNGNFHTQLAVLFTLAAAGGYIQPANIEAYSTVFNIKNATVDSSATAVANNLSVTLETPATEAAAATTSFTLPGGCHGLWCPGPNDPATLSNHIVIADITQFAYANVTAVSNVCDVTLNDYSNLSPNTDDLSATLGRPIVNSTATAVGNNVSITVGVAAPTVE